MAKNSSFGSQRRIGAAKVHEFGALVEGFKLGYRNREDKTVLPPGVLIEGSQNVLTNVAQHIAVRKGYTLDGSTVNENQLQYLNCESTASWTDFGGGDITTRTVDSTLYKEGTGSLSFAVDTASTVNNFATVQYSGQPNLNISSYSLGKVTFWFYVDAVGFAGVTYYQFTMFTDNGSNFLAWATPLHSQITQIGWNYIELDLNAPEFTGGSFDFTNFDFIWIGTIHTAGTANYTFKLDNIQFTAPVAIAPILASYDWDMHIGQERHLRAGFNTTGANGRLQYRYVDSVGIITWRNLIINLSSINFNFTTFWDFNTEKKDFLLFVNGSSNIYEWTGALATFASATANTVTIQGTLGVAELNFYSVAPFGSLVINDAIYAYTGVSGTTFTGVSPDPSLANFTVGSLIHQAVKVTANSAMTAIPATFANALIANLRNQIYIGSLTDRTVYISKVNNYKDFAFTSPVRVVGEGATVILDGVPTGFIAQEDKMTLSAGKDQWYETKFTLSSDLAKESFEVTRLKTTSRQAAQSQAAMSKINNDIAFVSFEPTLNTLGRIANVVLTQQTSNISDPVKNDFDNYNFTNCSVAYFRQFIYVAIPANNTVRIFNITNNYWEAPQILPISRFAIIGGELYGHSYQVGETYKLFSGYNDNGGDISAIAKFSFQNYGVRTASKYFNQFYLEGYISSNTTLNLNFQFDIDGCATYTSFPIVGTDSRIVCLSNKNASLGKVSLGKNPLGSTKEVTNPNGLPPKFRVVKTFPSVPFYEQSTSLSSIGIDQQWEILAFGGAEAPTSEGNNAITV